MRSRHENVKVWKYNGKWHWECRCTHCSASVRMQYGNTESWAVSFVQAEFHGKFFHPRRHIPHDR